MANNEKSLSEKLAHLEERRKNLEREIGEQWVRIGFYADHPQGDDGIQLDLEMDSLKTELTTVEYEIDQIKKSLYGLGSN